MLLQYGKDWSLSKELCLYFFLDMDFSVAKTYLCLWNISLQDEAGTAANSKHRWEFKQMNAWSQQCFVWVNWDFYMEVRVAEDASCWPVQWDFPTSFPSFWLLCWRVSLESDCKPRCLRQQAVFGSHGPRWKHHSRKLREQSLREGDTQTAFWNFIYPSGGEMNFMDKLRGDMLSLWHDIIGKTRKFSWIASR